MPCAMMAPCKTSIKTSKKQRRYERLARKRFQLRANTNSGIGYGCLRSREYSRSRSSNGMGMPSVVFLNARMVEGVALDGKSLGSILQGMVKLAKSLN